MVELLCRADQRPGSSRFREASFVDLAQNLARAVTEGSDHDSPGSHVSRPLYWPPVKVRHPWPTERFAVSHPR